MGSYGVNSEGRVAQPGTKPVPSNSSVGAPTTPWAVSSRMQKRSPRGKSGAVGGSRGGGVPEAHPSENIWSVNFKKYKKRWPPSPHFKCHPGQSVVQLLRPFGVGYYSGTLPFAKTRFVGGCWFGTSFRRARAGSLLGHGLNKGPGCLDGKGLFLVIETMVTENVLKYIDRVCCIFWEVDFLVQNQILPPWSHITVVAEKWCKCINNYVSTCTRPKTCIWQGRLGSKEGKRAAAPSITCTELSAVIFRKDTAKKYTAKSKWKNPLRKDASKKRCKKSYWKKRQEKTQNYIARVHGNMTLENSPTIPWQTHTHPYLRVIAPLFRAMIAPTFKRLPLPLSILGVFCVKKTLTFASCIYTCTGDTVKINPHIYKFLHFSPPLKDTTKLTIAKKKRCSITNGCLSARSLVLKFPINKVNPQKKY